MRRIYLLYFYLLCNGYFLKAQDLDPYQFFPCSIGDHWEYTQAGPDIIHTVLSDSIDKKDSSRFVFFFNPPLYYGANYRIDKNFNVFFVPQLDNWHMYKLDAKLGESWIAVPKIWAEKVMDISQVYVFGKLTTVKTIGFYRLTNGDTVLTANSKLQYWQKLAYGFGMISQENGAEQPTLLRGCKINGVIYGTVDVKDNFNGLPSELVLYQNYPNPFNPSTTISFSLPKYSHVIIKIYDILGREVETLVNEERDVGLYSVTFDATYLASGVYFYTLTTKSFNQTRKMFLLK